MSQKSGSYILFGLIAAGISAATVIRADALVQVTSVGAQRATDAAKWSQLGPDNWVLPQSVSLKSVNGNSYTISLAGANSVTSVVCSANPCSWTGAGFTAGDTLLWTSDAAAGGNGPVTVKFTAAVAGVGAFVQADTPGQFTVQIQAYNGATLLGTFTALSNSNGDATYIGVNDQTGPNVTSVVFSLAKCSGLCTDFAIDTLNVTPTTNVSLTNLTITSGVAVYQAINSLTASAITISGSANVSSLAGSTIFLLPEFRATAGTASTTFRAAIE